MAMKSPKVFTVGVGPDADFTPEEIELLIYKIRDWFSSDECDRNYADPLEEAKSQVEQCLFAQKKNGKIWDKAPDSFEARIKIKTLFDMVEGKHATASRAKTVQAKINAEHKKQVEQAKQGSPGTMVSTIANLQNYQYTMEQNILKTYPELDTPVHRPNVTRLAMLYTEQERIRIDMPSATGNARVKHLETLSLLQKSIAETMKSMDIYPDQMRKRMDAKRKGSIGDLVSSISDDSDFKSREKLWSLTLALQLWWMTKHPNGKQTGPQIHDFEMWHLTRTRPIRYTCRCGSQVTLVEGFTPEELKDYLLANGVLVEKPIIPQLISEEELHGLNGYSGRESTHEDQNLDGSVVPAGDVGDSPDSGSETQGEPE